MGFFVPPPKELKNVSWFVMGNHNCSGGHNLLQRASNEFQVVLRLAELLCNTEHCVTLPEHWEVRLGWHWHRNLGVTGSVVCRGSLGEQNQGTARPHAPVPPQEEQQCQPHAGCSHVHEKGCQALGRTGSFYIISCAVCTEV